MLISKRSPRVASLGRSRQQARRSVSHRAVQFRTFALYQAVTGGLEFRPNTIFPDRCEPYFRGGVEKHIFRPAATHAHTQPRRSAEGAHSVMQVNGYRPPGNREIAIRDQLLVDGSGLPLSHAFQCPTPCISGLVPARPPCIFCSAIPCCHWSSHMVLHACVYLNLWSFDVLPGPLVDRRELFARPSRQFSRISY
jgi:hypothetical protein